MSDIKIIMKKSIGKQTDGMIVDVKRGYGKYLIRENYAVFYSKAEEEALKNNALALIERKSLEIKEQEDIKFKIEDKEIIFDGEKVSESGQFYHVINSKRIADEINLFLDENQKINPIQIIIVKKIKGPSFNKISIKLKQMVTCSVFVNVSISQKAAEKARKEYFAAIKKIEDSMKKPEDSMKKTEYNEVVNNDIVSNDSINIENNQNKESI
jgi:ribosomal protein L9